MFEAFEKKELKNIFRRSAGLPNLVAALIKAKNDPMVVDKFMEYSEGSEIELRIHAMNILRKLFLESSLRLFMETFISRCLQIAIS